MSEQRLDAHLAGCAACRQWLAAVDASSRRVRLGFAVVPRDLTARLVAAVGLPSSPGRLVARLRVALGLLGGAQFVLGMTQLSTDPSGVVHEHAAGAVHVGHESAAWNVALGAAFAWVAWRRARPEGLLPMLTAAVVLLGLLGANDLMAGRVDVARLSTHLIMVAGYTVVLLLSRLDRDRVAPRRGGGLLAGLSPGPGFGLAPAEPGADRPRLRVVHRWWRPVRVGIVSRKSLRPRELAARTCRLLSRAGDRAGVWTVLPRSTGVFNLMRPMFRRGALILGLAVAAVFVVAGPASAHVTVNPNSATQGGYTKVAFRVPNEKDNATTTKVEVNFPTDTPIASVSVKPLVGWTAVTETAKLAKPITTDDGQVTEAVSRVTWTATGSAAIQPGQFQEFEVSLGPLPTTNQVVFKALQTYSDGDVVRWIDAPNADGSEPEHPAPVLHLAAGSGDDEHGTSPTAVAAGDSGSTDGGSGGLVWGIIGTILGAAALVVALLGFRARTSRT